MDLIMVPGVQREFILLSTLRSFYPTLPNQPTFHSRAHSSLSQTHSPHHHLITHLPHLVSTDMAHSSAA